MRRHKQKEGIIDSIYNNTFSADALEAELMIMMAAEANNSFMFVVVIVVLLGYVFNI